MPHEREAVGAGDRRDARLERERGAVADELLERVVAEVRQVRRDIARMKTIAAEKRSGRPAPTPAPVQREKPAAKRKRATRSKAKPE